jgi:hypothetical protein
MKAVLAALALVACGPPRTVAPGPAAPLPAARATLVDATPKERRRLVPPEAYLRAYLGWFGGLAPLDVQGRARPRGLFDAWDDYLAALGLPDDRLDQPRANQSNTLMLATLGRLGEALCDRAAERDLHGKPPAADARVVFAFELTAKPPTEAEFADRFDVLHRTFLGYPLHLAPPGRLGRFYALYQDVAARHGKDPKAARKAPLTPDEAAWAAICVALVSHPEQELY